ncbi:hypothetical protein Gotri_006252 [Gossypium trilobum]|uniref:Chaperonin-like RbcX protein n=1 Tax=Gossypium trilobum TaxID=34281 RepID=A0A7J9EZ98_9ROSI|nr:hypothetical protein [Gossypium trilobum]
MASLALLPLTQPSFLPSKPFKSNVGFPPSSPLNQRTSHATPLNCHKMYVPGNGASPEAKAAKNLHGFFNYITVKIVSAQLQSYNPEAYKDLMEFLNTHSLNDGDKFCASLMRESSRHKTLEMILVFGMQMVDESNTKLMREYVQETSRVTEKETGK